MSNAPFGRLLTAMVTPFTPSLEVDYDRAVELARKLIADGNDGLIVAGTTGESPTLSKAEKLELFKRVKQAVGKDIPIVAGTGSYATQATIELSQAAAETGVDGLLLVAPYYNKPPQEGMFLHFQAIARATRLPIMLYNIPGRTGIELLPETLARLGEIPSIQAVKQSLPSLDPINELAIRSDLAQYSGDDGNTLPILALGGVGVVSVAGHVAAGLIKRQIEAFFAGQVAEAARLQRQLYPLFTGLFKTSNPILVKAALKKLGFPVGGLRPPLIEATPEQEQALDKVLAVTTAA
ncbi:MAG: 4-hydroxy-tetrahydrodipicolinate synthase 2 [Candidatus Xenobia bacterium]